MIRERKYIEDSIVEWLEAIIADNGRKDTVVLSNQNGVRPPTPFIAIQFIGGGRPGQPFRSRVNPETEEQKLYAPSNKTLALHGIGEGSFDLLQTILDSIYIAKYRTMLKRKRLVVNKITDVTEVGNALDTVMESRARFDIRVSFIRVVTTKPGFIEHMELYADNRPSEGSVII